MPLPRLVASIALSVLATAACKTSSPYSTPPAVGIGTGLAVAAAAANRAVTHECWAACRPGTFCDHASGLCVEHATGAHGHSSSGASGQSLSLTSEPYLPGHEYEVPSMSAVDAGCAPHEVATAADGGAPALFCEMDGGGEL
jgi:hypothetical protein